MSKHRDDRAAPDDEAAVIELARAVGQLVRRLRAGTDAGGLSLSQSAAMARLEERGWMTIADLARAELVKPQSMGATLADLEADGLVRRRADPDDARRVLFGLTEKGTDSRRHRTRLKQAWLAAAFSRLTPEERRLLLSAIPLLKRLGAP